MKKRVLLKFFFYIALVAGGLFAVSQYQYIYDWYRLRGYVPSAVVESLATDSGMNELGRKIFYVYDPQLLSKDEFAQKCTVGQETIVLGCYISNQNIYVFDVEDERLEGIKEVTAAHEMLHAAYDRLSSEKQDEINNALQSVYRGLDNQRILDTVESYRARNASIVNDELHSILPTEVRELPAILEQHYSNYFDDRLKVVSLAEKYADEFVKRKQEIAAYDDQLLELQGNITRSQADISLQSQALTQERTLLEGLRGDPAAFNQAVSVFNARVNEYNAGAEQLKALIARYNGVVAERNLIALEERELVEAIDTRVDQTPVPEFSF